MEIYLFFVNKQLSLLILYSPPSDKHLFMSRCQWTTHAGFHEQKKIQFRAANSGGDWSASSDDMLATDWLALN